MRHSTWQQQRKQWELDKAKQTEPEQTLRDEYDRARMLAFNEFCRSEEGSVIYKRTFPILLTIHKVTDPQCATDDARQATLTRMEQHGFKFPPFAQWMQNR